MTLPTMMVPMLSSAAVCLHQAGVSMPQDFDKGSGFDMSAFSDVLRADLPGPSTLLCFACNKRQLLVWSSTYMIDVYTF